MKTQTIIRFAVLCALFGASAATTAPAFAQKEDRNGRSGTAKQDRNREEQNKNKESRSAGTSKSDKGSSKSRKERR